MKRGSAEGSETSQQEGRKWQRCLQGKRERGLQRGMTSEKCFEEKQLGKEHHSYRCVRDGSKIIQLGSSSDGRLFISAIHSSHGSPSSNTVPQIEESLPMAGAALLGL